MNFLAHLHLSYPDHEEMVGNFIGDYVKGRKFNDYPKVISRGIQLHRRIDFFTDTHPLQRECKVLFSSDYGLYAGIITDMLFDHYLARQWNTFSPISLQDFAMSAYDTLDAYHHILPERVQGFLPKMKAAKRLESYATLEGLADAILLMTKYTSLPDHTDKAVRIIKNNDVFFEQKFIAFYNELIVHTKEMRKQL